MEGHFKLGLALLGGKICCPHLPLKNLAHAEFQEPKTIKVNLLEQMGKQRQRGGGGAKAWSRARSKLANLGVVLSQAS